MAFVYEIVPEKDIEFWKSMGIKNCWGSDLLQFYDRRKWIADHEKNAFLIPRGGDARCALAI